MAACFRQFVMETQEQVKQLNLKFKDQLKEMMNTNRNNTENYKVSGYAE